MTISILEEATRRQVLKVDMLKQRTMAPGDGGLRLARTVNDLNLVASLPSVLGGAHFPPLKDPEAGTSPGPWSVVFDDQGRFVEVRSLEGAIAKRTFPKGQQALYSACRDVLQRGLPLLNEHLLQTSV